MRRASEKRSQLRKPAVSGVLYPSTFRECSVEGGKIVVGKDALSNGDNHNLERIVKRSPFKNKGEKVSKMAELQCKVLR